MNTSLNLSAIKERLNQQTSEQLINILSFRLDDYEPEVIPIIESILIDRGYRENEIESFKNIYNSTQIKIDEQPGINMPAKFWSRFFNYIVDHFICYSGVYFIQTLAHYTKAEEGAYYATAMAIYIGYYTLTIGLFGATIGMLIMGIKVMDKNKEKTGGFFEGAARGFFMVLNFLTLQLSNFIMLFNDKRLTLIDRLTDTRIVYNK